jgi:drug/metabolite transporter (DMT)-like permease
MLTEMNGRGRTQGDKGEWWWILLLGVMGCVILFIMIMFAADFVSCTQDWECVPGFGIRFK